MKKIMFFIIFLLLLSCEKNGNVDNSENLANSKNISDNNENIKKTNNENIEKIWKYPIRNKLLFIEFLSVLL